MRILIVSQANGAIDNVLKGLDSELTAEMIRCGKIDKIDEGLQHISFDEKYAAYTDTLQQNSVPPHLQAFSQRWRDLVLHDDRQQAPIVGEIFVRNHKIVGATCLGLMQRKIGLHRVEFDLVIIDEAGKALPAELLIPINRTKKCIMIGDHKQLPPVIHPALYDAEKIELSEADYCRNELFTTSLFKRLYETLPTTNKLLTCKPLREELQLLGYYKKETDNNAHDVNDASKSLEVGIELLQNTIPEEQFYIVEVDNYELLILMT